MVTAMVTLYSEEVGGASVEIRTLETLHARRRRCAEGRAILVSGGHRSREGTSVATDQIRAQLTFRIPIIDLQPHARVAADNVSLESQRMADITIILATRTPPSNPEQKYGAVAVIGPAVRVF
jgi:hypothetical protein